MTAETLTATRADPTFPVFKGSGAGAVCAAYGTYEIAANVEAGDIFKMCKVPKGATIIGGGVYGDDLDTGARNREAPGGAWQPWRSAWCCVRKRQHIAHGWACISLLRGICRWRPADLYRGNHNPDLRQRSCERIYCGRGIHRCFVRRFLTTAPATGQQFKAIA